MTDRPEPGMESLKTPTIPRGDYKHGAAWVILLFVLVLGAMWAMSPETHTFESADQRYERLSLESTRARLQAHGAKYALEDCVVVWPSICSEERDAYRIAVGREIAAERALNQFLTR